MAYTYVILIFLNDIIIINSRNYIPNGVLTLLSAWRDLFVLFGIISYVIWYGRSGRVMKVPPWARRALVIMAALILQGIILGIARNNAFPVLINARAYTISLLLPLILYLNGAFKGKTPLRIMMVIFTASIIMSIYSVYLSRNFDGDPRSLWYFDFILESKTSRGIEDRFVIYQIIRDGQLRAAGFLISAVDYTIFC